MEPMLLFALGFVTYAVYLTAKDFTADSRKDGLLMPCRSKVTHSGENHFLESRMPRR